ncbi:hypothetical protein [Microbispora sp. NPDC049125]|uniref:hypothetical protein n=1 Tax=Microbispora sp. NPDC049125 TaxID=3154929 RepID=UPI00346765B3
MQITETVVTTTHTVKDGDRMIGLVIGSDEHGWRGEYWVPVFVDGVHYGQYGIKNSPDLGQRMDNVLLWLSDQDALYGHRPEVAIKLCR